MLKSRCNWNTLYKYIKDILEIKSKRHFCRLGFLDVRWSSLEGFVPEKTRYHIAEIRAPLPGSIICLQLAGYAK